MAVTCEWRISAKLNDWTDNSVFMSVVIKGKSPLPQMCFYKDDPTATSTVIKQGSSSYKYGYLFIGLSVSCTKYVSNYSL